MESLINTLLGQIEEINRRMHAMDTTPEGMEHLARSEQALIECLLAIRSELSEQPVVH